jgi:hypothetical protein
LLEKEKHAGGKEDLELSEKARHSLMNVTTAKNFNIPPLLTLNVNIKVVALSG